jgi:uncharacterized protein (DUF433 family)
MPLALIYPHIEKQPGEPARLERHPRTRVAMIVLDCQGRGWSPEEIVRQYSYLTLAEVHAALTYYYDHQSEIDLELDAEWAQSERLRLTAPESPLLKRLRALKRQTRHAA